MKVYLEVALGGEPVATDRAHEVFLSRMGMEMDLQGAISLQNLAIYTYSCKRVASSLGFTSTGEMVGFSFSFLDGSITIMEKGL